MIFSNFFSYVQETPWYYQFLSPVVDEIDQGSKLLDIGTGTGKLLQMAVKKKNVNGIGIDTDESMLHKAKKKLNNVNVELIKIESTNNYPFKNHVFETITICNVLFNLDHNSNIDILTEVLRILKKEGKIVVLTPTGISNLFSLTKNYFSLNNLSIYIWFYATRNRAGPWTKNKLLFKFSEKNNLKYKKKIILNGFAQVEIITS